MTSGHVGHAPAKGAEERLKAQNRQVVGIITIAVCSLIAFFGLLYMLY